MNFYLNNLGVNLMKKKIYENALEHLRIGKRAVRLAQEDNREKGLPNVYSDGKNTYYQLPDGTFTSQTPEILQKDNQ